MLPWWSGIKCCDVHIQGKCGTFSFDDNVSCCIHCAQLHISSQLSLRLLLFLSCVLLSPLVLENDSHMCMEPILLCLEDCLCKRVMLCLLQWDLGDAKCYVYDMNINGLLKAISLISLQVIISPCGYVFIICGGSAKFNWYLYISTIIIATFLPTAGVGILNVTMN